MISNLEVVNHLNTKKKTYQLFQFICTLLKCITLEDIHKRLYSKYGNTTIIYGIVIYLIIIEVKNKQKAHLKKNVISDNINKKVRLGKINKIPIFSYN